MERLWYKVASRSVEVGDFALGLRASACLQMCLDQRQGDDLGTRVQSGADGALLLVSEGGEDELWLRSFAPPGATTPMALAKLVSGASLNACRCCLEVGSREALVLMTKELSLGAGRWIDTVSELGDIATAGKYTAVAGDKISQDHCHIFVRKLLEWSGDATLFVRNLVVRALKLCGVSPFIGQLLLCGWSVHYGGHSDTPKMGMSTFACFTPCSCQHSPLFRRVA